jgi:Na+-driven multidrug efflux pump
LQLKWFKPITLNFVITELPSIRKITMPVLISNWFTPIGSIIVVLIVSSYGSEAMAGLAVVGSLSPILFSVFFSITGAAGPMVGQNIGAKQPQRIAKIYRSGLAFIALYTLCIWLVALPAIDLIIQFYGLSGLPASLIEIYCSIQIPLSMGLGAIALSNGIFNNLGRPRWSMWLSLARATLGTLLLCHLGNLLFGLYGTVIGASLTFFVFGLIAICLANRLFKTHYPQISLLRL